MGNAILAVCIALAVATAYVSVRTIIETRRRYYQDYLKRKGSA